MEDTARQVTDQIFALFATYGLNVVGAIVVLIVGLITAGWAKKMVQRMLRRTGRVDDTLTVSGQSRQVRRRCVHGYRRAATIRRRGDESGRSIWRRGSRHRAGLARHPEQRRGGSHVVVVPSV